MSRTKSEGKMKLTEQESMSWIKSRRSVYPKMFDQGEVKDELILEFLEAARWAPTHKLTQPWRFRIYRGEAKTYLATLQGKLLEAEKGRTEMVLAKQEKMLKNAEQSAFVLAIIMKRDEARRIPEFEEVCAVASAVQNLSLHASSLGLGGYWSTGACTNYTGMRHELNLSEDDIHLGWFYVGKFSNSIKTPENRLAVADFASFV